MVRPPHVDCPVLCIYSRSARWPRRRTALSSRLPSTTDHPSTEGDSLKTFSAPDTIIHCLRMVRGTPSIVAHCHVPCNRCTPSKGVLSPEGHLKSLGLMPSSVCFYDEMPLRVAITGGQVHVRDEESNHGFARFRINLVQYNPPLNRKINSTSTNCSACTCDNEWAVAGWCSR